MWFDEGRKLGGSSRCTLACGSWEAVCISVLPLFLHAPVRRFLVLIHPLTYLPQPQPRKPHTLSIHIQAMRLERGYDYEDTCTVSRETMPNYDEKIKSFFEEHIHSDEVCICIFW